MFYFNNCFDEIEISTILESAGLTMIMWLQVISFQNICLEKKYLSRKFPPLKPNTNEYC